MSEHIDNLLEMGREVAETLASHGERALAVDLAEQVGQCRAERAAQDERFARLAAYHQKRSHDCDGVARAFHLDAVKLLKGEA